MLAFGEDFAIIEIVEAHIQEKKMNKKSIERAENRLLRAGFRGWQVAAYRGWLKSLPDRRKWREMTKRAFGVRV